ncbi:MAG: hypothetical protein FWD80_07190, partial [Propionibacteriaceae bacterium]|nr:hypothetical protein [Propionibacteriaceae bacterium]
YYGLYYESRVTPVHIQADGFVVPGSEVAAFLEKTLTTLGLSWREAEEFIVYWLPQMQDNPYNYIRFESLDEIDANQTLTISPQPDSMIRIWMTWQPLSQPISVSPQPLTPQTRSGFTAVEWGGIRIV